MNFTNGNIGMMLIADSGSTKTDWMLLDHEQDIVKTFSTKGLNPNILSDKQIAAELISEIQFDDVRDENVNIYFYGAGCSGRINTDRIKGILQSQFSKSVINVHSDIEAAVFATCNNKPAIVAILGTGSNSCFFSEDEISGLEYSLGYILGDEGSGSYFGKKLLRDHFYGKLPVELQEKFNANFELSRDEVIERIYRQTFPNEFIASFLPFYQENINHPWCKKIIDDGLEEFLRIYIQRFNNFEKVPVHFIGSVAYFFEDQLKEQCGKLQINPGKIIRSPIPGLAEYHIQMNNTKL